jgi:lysozyme family protein
MANFDLFLPALLAFEGGYVHNPLDPGGETNKGITLALFRQHSLPILGIEPTSANLKALTNAQAGILYKKLFWDKIFGDQIDFQPLANIVCDFFVNSGTHATKLFQRVLNSMGAQLTEDGVIGAASIEALAQLSQVDVYRRYKAGRISYYESLSDLYPSFITGWLNRANAFPDL